MNKAIALLFLVVLGFMGVGCLSDSSNIYGDLPDSILPVELNQEQIGTLIVNSGTIGIGDAKVWVGSNQGLFTGGGYYPGARAEHVIPIYNYYPQDVRVQLVFELPPPNASVILSDGTEDYGYVPAPSYVKDWVTFEEDVPLIPANSMRKVLVTLQMPKNEEVFAEKWEFRVTAIAMGQGKMQTAVSQRWLVTMKAR